MRLPLPRPIPPTGAAFAPAPELDLFVRTVFLDRGSRLFIEQHEILEQARIGYLWAWPDARDRGRTILGTAQLLTPPPQSKWPMLRSRWQLDTWFGDIDFLITLSAPFCAEEASDGEFLALLDHELSHCAQAERDGCPVFQEDGTPKWGIRGHDLEQFVGVVERWGSDAAGATELVRAAQQKPRFGQADIARIVAGCGTVARAA